MNFPTVKTVPADIREKNGLYDDIPVKTGRPAPIAHMYPSDLERFATEEIFAHAYSIPVGNPNEDSVPLYSEKTVYELQDRIGSLLHLLGRCEIFIKAVDAENGRHILNDIQEARGES